jgi:DNA polymerase-3 subunit delta
MTPSSRPHTPPLPSLMVIHGDEPLLVIEAADAFRASARLEGYTDREVLVVTPTFQWDSLFQASAHVSLFGAHKLIDLRMPTGKPGREGAQALREYAQTHPEGVITLISLPFIDWQTRQSAWFNALVAAARVEECLSPALSQLPHWIAHRLARQDQQTSPDALQWIAAHVEGNLLAAHQEILKLGLLYPPGEITRAQVESAILPVARFEIDDLRAGLSQNDRVRCARILEALRAENAPTPLVLWALAHEARQRALRQPEQKRSCRAALQWAAKADRMIKGVSPGDIWDAFLHIVLRLTQPAARA